MIDRWHGGHRLNSGLFFKHEAYSNEQEYRFLESHSREVQVPGLRRRPRRYKLVKYREFDWRRLAPGALKEIVLGPADPFFIIVPIKNLSTLQRLTVAPRKAYDYLSRQKLPGLSDFYYVTRDTGDPPIGLRSRGIFSTSEDPATGSAAGCTGAWMVRYGIARPEQTVHILQGVEIKRPSHIFVRASKDGDSVKHVRVGGHAVEIMEGTFSL